MLFQKELTDVCVLYALTPVHAGSGQALSTVDLPIQRERHTNWPQVQSSGVKGAFRDWFRRFHEVQGDADHAEELAKRVFGREEGRGEEGVDGHAGAVSVTDARLLAFPVRSNIAPFVWVTCPGILTRLKRDLALSGASLLMPEIVPANDDTGIDISCNVQAGSSIIIEDLVVTTATHKDAAAHKEVFASLAPQVERLLLISDKAFSFLVETATEVQPQIKINKVTGTTEDGSLRYQELLPADAALYVVMFFGQERISKNPLAGAQIRDWVKAAIACHVQIGGDMTLGRGIMAVNWLKAGKWER